jgi:hypothetical protein
MTRHRGRAMATRSKESITAQAAGAYGEAAVVAELLRRNWIPSNVNRTVKNAEMYDIHAFKESNKRNRAVQIRVKSCRPNQKAVLFSGFEPGERITARRIGKTDFTVIVRMGDKRGEDKFYVVPTDRVWAEIGKRQKHKIGGRDIGMWRLSFTERRDGREEAGRGIERKWGKYLENWEQLD